jgi:hypothetical protein
MDTVGKQSGRQRCTETLPPARRRLLRSLVLSITVGPGLGSAICAAPSAEASARVRDLGWDDLIPSDWKPEKLLEGLNVAFLLDGDPRANEAMAKLRELWDKAPAVKTLHGQQVRLPGFVAPLERSPRGISEFLLVPYFGACIHSPPPPANQIVHVIVSDPITEKMAQGAVFASGRLEVQSFESALGVSGYRMPQAKVQVYQVPRKP